MSLTLISGPMFSAKTTRTIEQIERYYYRNYKCLIIKHKIDSRYNAAANQIITNSGICHTDKKYDIIQTDDLFAINVKPYHVIAINESQFFANLKPFVTNLVDIDNKHVICEGLFGDSNRNLFGDFYQLISHADKIYYLNSVCCNCGADAIFTKKKSNNNDGIIEIGSGDVYMPMCRKCYLNN